MLAIFYERGLGGEKDRAEALHWYRLATDNNHPYAAFVLGRMYDEGDGVHQDPAEALRFYEKAAVSNYKPAQHSLGRAYDAGIGVARDRIQAAKWLMLATDGSASARQRVEEMFQRDPFTSRVYQWQMEPSSPDATADFKRVLRELSVDEIEIALDLVRNFEPDLSPLIPRYCGPHGCPYCE
jgi:hypothetical protein